MIYFFFLYFFGYATQHVVFSNELNPCPCIGSARSQSLYIVDFKSYFKAHFDTPDFVVEAVIFWGTVGLMDYTIKINFTSFF